MAHSGAAQLQSVIGPSLRRAGKKAFIAGVADDQVGRAAGATAAALCQRCQGGA